jgi:putative transposase
LRTDPLRDDSMAYAERALRIDPGMPRPPRAVITGETLHIIQRGNNRGACFVDDDDREFYLAALLRASRRARCDVHAYVLMTNHVHLLVTAGAAEAPALMMKTLGCIYVRHFNERFERTGTLWEGRYRSARIDSDLYFLQCSRYIEMNPVRAGVAITPGAWRWSSFRSNADGQPDALVRPHALYLALGQTGSKRREAYRALFATPLHQPVIDAIRRATNKGVALTVDDSSSDLTRRLARLSHMKRTDGGRDRAAS